MKNANTTRHTLLQRLQLSHDERAWDEFSGIYGGYIRAILRGYGFSPDDSDDLLQEVMIKVWKALPGYTYGKRNCKFRTWLGTVIRNAAINHRRQKMNRDRRNTIAIEEMCVKLELKSDAEIEEITLREWKLHVYKMAWGNVADSLSDTMRAVFEESQKEDDNAVLAQKFGVTESSIRVYKMRVRKVLIREIARLDADLDG